ncbi:MAG: DUF3298 domain-containing protein [Ruminococcaceae bacterium]|nr:DUF3298 domain-containing protein [Oscillospiraceae bacterium]
MKKHCDFRIRKNIIRWSIAVFAVLFVVLLIFSDSHLPDKKTSPAIMEMNRLYESELTALQQRDAAYLEVFAGDESSEKKENTSGTAELDILCVTDSAISFAIRPKGEDVPFYGRDKYYNIDRNTGEHLDLMLVFGGAYRDIILDALIPKIAADEDVYEGFDVVPLIHENRPFYLTDGGSAVVIVFDRGEIAPDNVGTKLYRVEKK